MVAETDRRNGVWHEYSLKDLSNDIRHTHQSGKLASWQRGKEHTSPVTLGGGTARGY